MPSLCLNRLPFWVKTQHIRKAFKAAGVPAVDEISLIFKRNRIDKGYITFKSEEALQQFKDGSPYTLRSLGKLQWEDISDTDVSAVVQENDEYKKRVRNREWKDGDKRKKAKTENQVVEVKTATNVVSPSANLTYQVQLQRKRRAAFKSYQLLTKELTVNIIDQRSVERWNYPYIASLNSPACAISGILGSPEIRGYRNKDELTCGVNKAKEVSVGYQLGRYPEDDIGHVGVGVDLPNSNLFTQVMADVMKKIIEESRFSPYSNHEQNSDLGVFRKLTLRTTTTKTAMVVITIKNNQLSDDDEKEVRELIKERIVEQLEDIKKLSGGYEIKSLQAAHFSGVSNFVPDDSPLTVLYGSDHIIEEMMGLKFRISPFSFFQVNTKSAENLYQLVADYADCNENTILFDVCCGTGTIGITLAKHVKKVYGFEIIEKAIKDCKFNANLNGCENTQFFLGNCEETLPKMLGTLTPEEHKNVIVILDPPRAGMHKKVLKLIRATMGLDKIVYVSCNRKTQVDDMIKLCRPKSKSFQGRPFRPIISTVVDLFPHTAHAELVTLLNRVDDEFEPEKYEVEFD